VPDDRDYSPRYTWTPALTHVAPFVREQRPATGISTVRWWLLRRRSSHAAGVETAARSRRKRAPARSRNLLAGSGPSRALASGRGAARTSARRLLTRAGSANARRRRLLHRREAAASGSAAGRVLVLLRCSSVLETAGSRSIRQSPLPARRFRFSGEGGVCRSGGSDAAVVTAPKSSASGDAWFGGVTLRS
jgi:hypothetical protein